MKYTRVKGSLRGFTLVELLVTIVIVSILAVALIPLSELNNQRVKERELRSALQEIRHAIDEYKQAGDDGRIARKANESGYPHTLNELVDGIDNAKSTETAKVYFLRRIPRDPLYPDHSIASEKTWGLRSYASSHTEPQEGKDVFDVYSTAQGNALDGSSYRDW
jgi:general secretion pathway protein G